MTIFYPRSFLRIKVFLREGKKPFHRPTEKSSFLFFLTVASSPFPPQKIQSSAVLQEFSETFASVPTLTHPWLRRKVRLFCSFTYRGGKPQKAKHWGISGWAGPEPGLQDPVSGRLGELEPLWIRKARGIPEWRLVPHPTVSKLGQARAGSRPWHVQLPPPSLCPWMWNLDFGFFSFLPETTMRNIFEISLGALLHCQIEP